VVTQGKSSLLESIQITITLTYGVLLIFLQSEVEKLLGWLRLNPTTFDPSFQSGSFDHQATAPQL